MRDSTTVRLRRARLGLLCLAFPALAYGQTSDSTMRSPSPHYWRTLGLGVTTSILLHEAGHVAASIAVGGHPSFGFDELRPTIYSGLDSRLEPHKQFLFSISGLAVQTLLDEAILDVPHSRGSAFERGLLGGGIGTTVFYLTIGRRGSVSDVDFIARTHAMTKTQVTLLFGGIAALHTIRIASDEHYANFFVGPGAGGRVNAGVNLNVR